MNMQINPKVGSEHGSFKARAIEIVTESGRFSIGLDNDGQTYVACISGRMIIIPAASNRITVSEE